MDSSVAEDSCHLGCGTVWLGEQWPVFWRIMVPLSLRVKHSFGLEDEGTVIFWNNGNPTFLAQHHIPGDLYLQITGLCYQNGYTVCSEVFHNFQNYGKSIECFTCRFSNYYFLQLWICGLNDQTCDYTRHRCLYMSCVQSNGTGNHLGSANCC